MKKSIKLLFIVIIPFILMSFVSTEEMEGTYLGMSDNDEYVFSDDNGDRYYFREIDSDVEIDLNDEEFIGSSFKVTYIYVDIPVYDEEGEETGETEEILRITNLEEI